MPRSGDKNSERRARGVVESAMDSIVAIDGDQRIVLFNPAAERMFGLSAREILGEPLSRLIPERFRLDHGRHVEAFSAEGVSARPMGAWGEIWGLRADGEEFAIDASIARTSIDGEPVLTVFLRDVSARKALEEARTLLAREVDHRAKNALAVAQAIVRMTRADSVEAFASLIEGRISALARAHALLSENRWHGADLALTVAGELAPYARPAQLQLSGPSVMLRPGSVQPIGMIVHELGINACKYGSLLHDAGMVAIDWEVRPDGSVDLQWRESGGPEVTAPGAAGFGTNLLNQVVTRQLHGRIFFDWAREGLGVSVSLPAPQVRPDPQKVKERRPSPVLPQLSDEGAGPTVLVVEDEALVAMELKAELAARGWRIVGPAGTLDEAMDLVRRRTDICAAVLDVNLEGVAIEPLVERLKAVGVPFVLCTGYSAQDMEARFGASPLAAKPVDIAQLDQTLRRMVDEAAGKPSQGRER